VDRRDFVAAIGAVAMTRLADGTGGLQLGNATVLSPQAGVDGALRPFHVEFPTQIIPLPFGSERPGFKPGFALRGIKGWGWSAEQYLAEIPVMAKYRLNFLMNDYSTLWKLGPHGLWDWSHPMNFWYRPLSAEKKAGMEEVVRLCQKSGIIFCFSMNPNLYSDRPFDYESHADLETLWQHYSWAQGLGVKWFNISLDDISRKIDANGHARLLNAMLKRLRKQDPEAELVFCPTWYAGTGAEGVETASRLGVQVRGSDHISRGGTPGVRYTRALATALDKDVYLFWTGPEVCSLTIDAEQARAYKALCGHRVVIWDNYPVNDQQPTMHLGPLTGRSADLSTVVSGYIANPMSFQNEADRIPRLTIADYLWNPAEYDPARSIGQSILHLSGPQVKAETLRDLVELYPGRLWDHSLLTKWNSLRARFDEFIQKKNRVAAAQLLDKAQKTLREMKVSFPDSWTSGTEVLQGDVEAMLDRFSKGKNQI
jgi:hypothetical protein